jgi:hypothetical protein
MVEVRLEARVQMTLSFDPSSVVLLSGLAGGVVRVAQSESEMEVLTVSPIPLTTMIADEIVLIRAFDAPDIEQGFATWTMSRHGHWKRPMVLRKEGGS